MAFMIACPMLLGPNFILLGKPLADWLCLCTAGIAFNNLRAFKRFEWATPKSPASA